MIWREKRNEESTVGRKEPVGKEGLEGEKRSSQSGVTQSRTEAGGGVKERPYGGSKGLM